MGKSKRNESIKKSQKNPESQNINPLNYSNEFKNIEIKKKVLIPIPQKISAPFGSSSIKTTLNPSVLSNDPGPGTYGQSQIPNNIKIIFNTNKFFITGDTRFKSCDNHIPGVGKYNIDLYSIYNNKFNTPKKTSSYTYNRMNLHDFILNEKLATLQNKYPLYNLKDKNEDGEIYNTYKERKKVESNLNNNSFNGNNSYDNNLLILKKHNNAIDWKKVSKKNLETDTNINITKNIENDFVMLTEFNILNNDKSDSNKTNNEQKQVIYKNNIPRFKDNFDSSYINLTSLPIKNKTKKEEEKPDPGPGTYDPKNENFQFEPKKNRFQNFGSFESRNMLPIPLNKNRIKIINTENTLNSIRFKQKLWDSKNKLNKYKRLLHNLRLNLIKEQSKQYKNTIENNLGPGSYSPELFFNLKQFHIRNLSKTININPNVEKKPSYIEANDNPGVGEYDTLGEYKQNIEKNWSIIKSKKNQERIEHRIMLENHKKKLKKKERKIIRLDYIDTEEYRIRKQFMKNMNAFRPPFNSAEPKFKSIKKDDTNGVLNEEFYYQIKDSKYSKVPFLSKAKRKSNEVIDSNSIEKVGPGSYEQKSFFDWNKKSFNVQYKLK